MQAPFASGHVHRCDGVDALSVSTSVPPMGQVWHWRALLQLWVTTTKANIRFQEQKNGAYFSSDQR